MPNAQHNDNVLVSTGLVPCVANRLTSILLVYIGGCSSTILRAHQRTVKHGSNSVCAVQDYQGFWACCSRSCGYKESAPARRLTPTFTLEATSDKAFKVHYHRWSCLGRLCYLNCTPLHMGTLVSKLCCSATCARDLRP